jgi:hypothetical protein
MHNKAAWPSGVWTTSGTVSNRRIIDVTVMETSAAGLSSLLMYAILRRKQNIANMKIRVGADPDPRIRTSD